MNEIEKVLTRGVKDILPSKEGLAKLIARKKITVYQGFDPSAPSLHLGNMVGLMKLRAFQKLGHKIIFLIGDFSGMIGDPTDKMATRKKLTREETTRNMKSWKLQASKIIDFSGKNPAKLVLNSTWLDKISFRDLIEIASNFTVGQMIERDMFQERLKQSKPIHLHEFLYPVATAIDCVQLNVDLEIGGNDQLFNMMMGRQLINSLKNKEKFVLTTKLLVDKEGVKAGKTAGNALFLDSNPKDFYCAIMSFPDECIYTAFELLTETDMHNLSKKINDDPMQMKQELAYSVTAMIFGDDKALLAKNYFSKTFQLCKPDYSQFQVKGETILDVTAKLTGSKSHAKRLIFQGAVDVNGNKITDPKLKVSSKDKIRVGSHTFAQVK